MKNCSYGFSQHIARSIIVRQAPECPLEEFLAFKGTLFYGALSNYGDV